MTPALQIMTFDGSIKRISCITQHEDFGPMTHRAVLENVRPPHYSKAEMVVPIEDVHHNLWTSKLYL
jgi:hypothetical protein